MKKLLAAVVGASVLLVAPVLPVGAAKIKPVTVMTDAKGDAGNQGSALPGATEAGFDLVKGVVGQKGKNVTFTVEHAEMPATGSAGEAARLVWGLAVNGKVYQMTVKSLDVGKPDVLASALMQDPQGEERVGKVYQGVARLEECGTEQGPNISFSKCTVLEYHSAKFDAAKKTASWSIPLKALKAKKGSTIAGGGILADTGCMICWVPHYGERSLTPVTIIDAATPTKVYKVK